LCWQPSQLRVRFGDAKIRQNLKAAYRPRPARPYRGAEGRRAPYGAIRRVNLPGDQKVVAITFDLCEQPHEISGYQGDIVDYLRDENIPATFFATGKWLLTHPTRGEQIMADPILEVGNHGWSHRNFRLLDGAARSGELEGAQVAYRKTRERLARRACLKRDGRNRAEYGVPKRQQLMRFPFGACDAAALKAVHDRNLYAVQWDVSSADPWKGQTVEAMVRHVVRSTRSGSIVLFHANGRGYKTAQALPIIVEKLRARGFRFMRVSDMLALPGATPELTDQCYDAKPGDSNRYDSLSARLERLYGRYRAKFNLSPDDPS